MTRTLQVPSAPSLPGDGSRRISTTMHDHVRSEGARALPIDWLVTPALAFSHPNEVLNHPELSQAEQRAILASWASDARAVEGAHWMRCLDNGSVVTLTEVLDALRKLDTQTAFAAGRNANDGGPEQRPVGLGRAGFCGLKRGRLVDEDRSDCPSR